MGPTLCLPFKEKNVVGIPQSKHTDDEKSPGSSQMLGSPKYIAQWTKCDWTHYRRVPIDKVVVKNPKGEETR